MRLIFGLLERNQSGHKIKGAREYNHPVGVVVGDDDLKTVLNKGVDEGGILQVYV